MASNVDFGKRALLFGQISRPRILLTPPWAVPVNEFLDRCTRCGECVSACPEKILHNGDGGFPIVDFSSASCTFCGACVDSCSSGALSRATDPPWHVQADIGTNCLTRHGVYCQSCRDSCETRAIEFRHRAGEPVPVPQVNAAHCTGCGACVSVCPAAAIHVAGSSS